ncbi:MAG: phosphoadenylyl-sulfate reductase [Gammaproteobacteria bacterium]|nr:phosphoadenylyl-sulfate reductase [Gammaproteobacteria bacterium]
MAIQCGIDAVILDEEHLHRQPVEHWRHALTNAPLPYKYEGNISGIELSDQKLKSNRIIHDGTIDFLNARYTGIATEQLMEQVLNDKGLGKTAMVTSFGTESAVLLHMVAKYSPDTPVLFIDTGKLFPETLEYQKQLVEDLKLTNVIILRSEQTAIVSSDPEGTLWKIDISSCCGLRKVAPLQNALAGYDNWISGRKSYQSEQRSALKIFERSGNQIKINPLADWSHAELAAYIKQHNLPVHPLVSQGYSSVGCAPCTIPVCPGEDIRSGRWSGQNKTECGIHFIDGKVVRQGALSD